MTTTDHRQEDPRAIQMQIHEKKTSILDSTRRMLGLINESEVIGTNTAAVRLVSSLNLKISSFVFRNCKNKGKN